MIFCTINPESCACMTLNKPERITFTFKEEQYIIDYLITSDFKTKLRLDENVTFSLFVSCQGRGYNNKVEFEKHFSILLEEKQAIENLVISQAKLSL
jgi:hypothetical protein